MYLFLGKTLNEVPNFNGSILDLFKFYQLVSKRGGYQEVLMLIIAVFTVLHRYLLCLECHRAIILGEVDINCIHVYEGANYLKLRVFAFKHKAILRTFNSL